MIVLREMALVLNEFDTLHIFPSTRPACLAYRKKKETRVLCVRSHFLSYDNLIFARESLFSIPYTPLDVDGYIPI